MSVKGQAAALQKERGCNFDFHEDTRTFHCKKCGQIVGWLHFVSDRYFALFSSCVEGDSANGVCYDCYCEMRARKEIQNIKNYKKGEI